VIRTERRVPFGPTRVGVERMRFFMSLKDEIKIHESDRIPHPPFHGTLIYMSTRTFGIHHITAITADPQKNLDFYEGFLGQRLIKKTVNFDDPNAYHLYYADAVGTPGTVLTFFYWSQLPQGTRGSGEVASIYYSIQPSSLLYWRDRALEYSIPCTEAVLPFGETVLVLEDPDGLRVGLVATLESIEVVAWAAGPIPSEHILRGFYGALLAIPEGIGLSPLLTQALGYSEVATAEEVTRYQATTWPGKYLAVTTLDAPRASQGAGSVHHIAFQASDDAMLHQLREQFTDSQLAVTPVIDRFYFHASYFQTPAGILFELSTNDIGFVIDEPVETLGEVLQLPPQYAPYRREIEATIRPLILPRYRS